MTKRWQDFRDVIEELYRKHTLAVVREKMIDRYGFRASTRAYRLRLEKWGIHKYKPRNRGHREPITPSRSPDRQSPTNARPAAPRLQLSLGSAGRSNRIVQLSDSDYVNKALFGELSYHAAPEPTAGTPTHTTTTPTSTATTSDNTVASHGDEYEDMERPAPRITHQSALVGQELALVNQQFALLSQTTAQDDSFNRSNPVVVTDNQQFPYPSPYQWIDYPSV